MTHTLSHFFKPKSVAIIGASSNPGKLSHGILKNLITGSFDGNIFPVNPGSDAILGIKTFKNIEEIPENIDLAVISLPADLLPGVLKNCGDKGIPAAIIISGGFKEIGTNGEILENRCRDIAKQYSMRIMGPNCVGTLDLYSGLNTTFIKGTPIQGHIGFFSQSGAVCGGVVDYVQEFGIGFSSLASLGNEMDVDETDIIEYLWKDQNTRVIAGYIESIKDGKKFMQIARQVTKEKPIVLLKAGRNQAGSQAVSSHTGSIAGSYETYKAAFRQCGVISVDSLQELFDISVGFAFQPLPVGKNTIIITNSGGPAAISADNLEQNNLTLPVLNDTIQQKLANKLPPNSQVKNPVDMLGGADEKEYEISIKTTLNDPDMNNAIIILTPQALVNPVNIARKIFESTKSLNKTIVTCFFGGVSVKKARIYLHRQKIPMYVFPEQPVKVLGAMLKYQTWRVKPSCTVPITLDRDYKKAAALINSTTGKNIWGEADSRPILEAYQIPVIPGNIVSTFPDAIQAAVGIGFPVVMKIATEEVFHKADVGGIHLNIINTQGLEEAYSQMQERFPSSGSGGFRVLIEKMAPQGQEAIIGIKRDPTFGPVLMFGIGGALVELTRDVSFRILPVTETDITEMIEDTSAGVTLHGFRGSPPGDINSLIDSILRLSQIVEDFPAIMEIEINPLIVLEEGKGVFALDARILMG